MTPAPLTPDELREVAARTEAARLHNACERCGHTDCLRAYAVARYRRDDSDEAILARSRATMACHAVSFAVVDVPRLLATIAARDEELARVGEAWDLLDGDEQHADACPVLNNCGCGKCGAGCTCGLADRQRDARALLDGLRGRR